MTRAARFLVSIIALCIGSCAFATIDDLAFSSLQVVGRHDPLELEAMDAQYIPSHFEPPNELLLKMAFTSAVDLTRVDAATSVGNEVFFCGRSKADVRLALPGVYWQTSNVSWMAREAPIRQIVSGPKTLIVYHIFIRVALDEYGQGKPPFESFDLWSHPEDVCVRVLGGHYRALGYRSNIVIVPKEEISAALSTLSKSEATRRCASVNFSYTPPPARPCSSQKTP